MAEKLYTYDVLDDGLLKMQRKVEKLYDLFDSEDFKAFIAKKMEEALFFIQRELLTTIENEDDTLTSTYMQSNHIEIKSNGIYIYNDATIDINDRHISERAKADYPDPILSLAQMVEYGIGYTGSLTDHQEEVEDWDYDLHNHGYQGWYYINDSGEKIWTNGYRGRQIFMHLRDFTEKSLNTWIKEYLKQKL